MKIDTQQLENRQVKLTVEVDPAQLDEAKRRAARKIAQSTKIPGFRPGKAPYNIVERHVGPAAILEEAIEFLINDVYPKALEEAGIEPSGPGTFEGIPEKEPMTFEFIIPLNPSIELPDYRAIRMDYNREPVDEASVEQTITNIREQQAVVTPVERAVQDGDEVTIRLKAERKEVKEGESPTFIRERSVPIIVQPAAGSEESGDEWPYSGFSRHLVSLSVGDERTIPYTFPEDSSFELLRGAQVDYHFTVEGVKERKLPTLDDEFAQTMGEFDTLDALRNDIRERLEKQVSENYNSEYEDKVLEQIVADSKIEYPPQMLEDEIDALIRQLENRLSYQGLDIDAYLKSRNMEMPALREELIPVAETRLKKFLTLVEISHKEDIQVSSDEIQSQVTGMLSEYSQGMTPAQLKKAIDQETVANMIAHVSTDLTIQKSLERIRLIAAGEAPELTEPHDHDDQKPVKKPAKKSARKAKAEQAVASDATEVPAQPGEAQAAVEPKPRKSKKTVKTESE